MAKYFLRRLPRVKSVVQSNQTSLKIDRHLGKYKGKKAQFDHISVVYILDQTDTELLTHSIFALKKNISRPHVIFVDLGNNAEIINNIIKNYLPKSERIQFLENTELETIIRSVGSLPSAKENLLFINEHARMNEFSSVLDSLTLDLNRAYCLDFIQYKGSRKSYYIGKGFVNYYENLNFFRSYFPFIQKEVAQNIRLDEYLRATFKKLPPAITVKRFSDDFYLNPFKRHFSQSNRPIVVQQKGLIENYRFDFDKKVSIIILTRDKLELLQPCLKSIEKSSYKNYEVIIVDHLSNEETKAFLKSTPHKIVSYEGEFNFSLMNNLAAREATGDVICFLNNDTEVISEDWLEVLGSFAVQPYVGAVAPKLLFRNHLVQHAGIRLNRDLSTPYPASHVLTYEKDNPIEKELNLITSPHAVTGACVFVETHKFWEVGGFNEEYLITWQDVDLCLKLEAKGNETLCVPYIRLFHYESSTRKAFPTEKEAADLELFRKYWKE
jgi:GT2 family glycosyltransferase